MLLASRIARGSGDRTVWLGPGALAAKRRDTPRMSARVSSDEIRLFNAMLNDGA